MDISTKINLAGIELKNPVMTASGTFGSGMEYSEFVDLNQSGRGSDQGRGQCAVAWQSHSEDCGDLRRHDECNRAAESGD